MFKKTKIVCTIGPSSWDYETLLELAKAGMNVVRLNLSHGTHDEKRKQIGYVRQVSKKIGKPLAIIADLQGPKIRLGKFEGVREIKKGELIKLSSEPKNPDEIPMQFDLSPFVKVGQRIFLNDGYVEIIVTDIQGKTIISEAKNNGVISEKKGVNIPDTNLGRASFTEKDRLDAEFALNEKVDYVALSFVQTPDDLVPLKELIEKINPTTKIITKIEKKEAVLHLEEIVKQSDAVMVARGDLAIETSASEVPILQKTIIKLCRNYKKPVIVATQMLETMVDNPRPTRAETSDVANAVLDQSDAVMLSAETASGKYPIEAVKTMKHIITSVEKDSFYRDYVREVDIFENNGLEDVNLSAIASSAAHLARNIKAKLIAVATASGKTARLISSFRPSTDIITITHSENTSNQLSLLWGIRSWVIKPTKNTDEFWEKIIKEIKDYQLAKKGDKIVMVVGSTSIGVSGATDTIKVMEI